MSAEQLTSIANKLVGYCRNHKETECLDKLYADNAISVEAAAMPGSDSAKVTGRDAIKRKHEHWNSTMQVHSSAIDGPFLHGRDRFGVIYEIDATNKKTGQRMAMKELAIYKVSDNKIVREEFFYTM